MTLARAFDLGEEARKPKNPARYRRHLTRDLDAVLRKAMAKDPRARYGSMDAMRADLEAFLEARPVTARRAGPAYFAWRFMLRHRFAFGATVLAFLALGATALVAMGQSRVAVAEAARANAVADFLVGLFRVSDPGVNRGERLNANQILDQGAQRIETDLASQPEQRARLQSVIGEVYMVMGDYAKAKAAFDPAIATLESLPSANRFDLAHALNFTAHIATVQGDLDGALKILDRAEPLLDPTLPRQSDELGTLHARRAAVLDYRGDYVNARREYEAALKIRAQGGEAPTLKNAGLHNNYGNLLRNINDLGGARAQYDKALAIYREIYGAEAERNYTAVGTAMNLGMLLIDLDQLAEARERLVKASAFFAGMEVSVNLGYAGAEDKLGEIDRLERHFDEAFVHYDNAERTLRGVLGEHHHGVAQPINNRAQAELERGRPDAALALFDKALALRLETLPRTHREVATSLDGRSQALLALGRNHEARADAEEALANWRKALPAGHALLVYSLLHVGQVRYALGDTDGGRVAWQEALALAPAALADNPARLERIRDALGNPANAMRNLVPAGSYDE